MELGIPKGSATVIRASRLLLPLAAAAAIACLAAVATYGLLLFPAQTRLAELGQAYEIERVVRERQRAAHETQRMLQTIWRKFPVRKDFMELGVAIANLADRHRVRIPAMSYDVEPIKKYRARKGVLAFEVGGRYEAIRQFIYKLETTWPHLFIEKLAVKRSKRKNEVAFTITLATLLRPDPESSSSPSSS